MSKRDNKISLRKTHVLLFRLFSLFSIGNISIGLGVLINPYFMYANFRVLSEIFPTEVWGILWLTAGIAILAGLLFKYYSVCKVGVVISAALCVAWATAQFTGQFFGYTGVYSFISTIIYISSAAILIMLLFEPPINPQTAIGAEDD